MFPSFGGRRWWLECKIVSHTSYRLYSGKLVHVSKWFCVKSLWKWYQFHVSLNATCINLKSVSFFCISRASLHLQCTLPRGEFLFAKCCTKGFMCITSFYPKSSSLKWVCFYPVFQMRKLCRDTLWTSRPHSQPVGHWALKSHLPEAVLSHSSKFVS